MQRRMRRIEGQPKKEWVGAPRTHPVDSVIGRFCGSIGGTRAADAIGDLSPRSIARKGA